LIDEFFWDLNVEYGSFLIAVINPGENNITVIA
jgi:hypothetical protein